MIATTLRRKLLVAGIATVGMLVSAIYFLIQSSDHRDAILNGASAICGCETAFAWSQQPWMNGAILLLTTISALLLVRLFLIPVWQIIRTAQFLRKQRIVSTTLFADLPLSIFETDVPLLFTAGMTRPHIYMSSALLDQLSFDEREAALLHEIGHVQSRHVLVRTLAAGLPKRLRDILVLHQEHAADVFALQHSSRDAVVSALMRVCTTPAVGATAAFSHTDRRLQLLLGKQVALPASRALLLGALSLLLIFFSHSVDWASAMDADGLTSCLAQVEYAQEIRMSQQEAACLVVTQSEQGMSTQIHLLTPTHQSTILHR